MAYGSLPSGRNEHPVEQAAKQPSKQANGMQNQIHA